MDFNQSYGPLNAEPRVRNLIAKPAQDGRLLLVSDGPDTPQKLIKAEVLERTFGKGTDNVLLQPDHWRMISEHWFEDKDLYKYLGKVFSPLHVVVLQSF